MRKAVFVIGLPLAITFSSLIVTANAAGPNNADSFTVVKVRYDHTIDPKNAFETAGECLNNTTCKGIVDTAFVVYGIDSRYATTAAGKLFAVAHKPDDENKTQTITLPEGYSYCRSRFSNFSNDPNTGDRASKVSASSTPNGVSIESWAPKKGTTEGRGWADLDVELIGVKQSLGRKGRAHCASIKPHPIFSCRGGADGNKGEPPCREFVDGKKPAAKQALGKTH